MNHHFFQKLQGPDFNTLIFLKNSRVYRYRPYRYLPYSIAYCFAWYYSSAALHVAN